MTRTYSVFARVTTRHHCNQRAWEHGRHTLNGRRYCRLVGNRTLTYSVALLCWWVVSLTHRYELDTRTLAEVNGRPPIPFLAPRLDPSVRRSRAPSSHGHIVWYDRAVVADVGTVIMLKCSWAHFRSMSTRQEATWVETIFTVVRVKKQLSAPSRWAVTKNTSIDQVRSGRDGTDTSTTTNSHYQVSAELVPTGPYHLSNMYVKQLTQCMSNLVDSCWRDPKQVDTICFLH